MSTIKVTYKKSAIGYSQRQKDTIRSLGLKHLGHVVELPDNTAIRGMVHHVRHLVDTVEVAVTDSVPDERGSATIAAASESDESASGREPAGSED